MPLVSATGSWQKLSSIFSLLETDLSAMSGYRLSLVRDRQSTSHYCILSSLAMLSFI